MPPETPPRPAQNFVPPPRRTAPNLVALLVAYRSGGRAAQAAAQKISAHFWPEFMRYFIGNRRTPAEAEELAQEAMAKVFRHAASVVDDGAFSSWAWRIARNVLIDDRRHPERNDDVEIGVDDETWFVLMDVVPGATEIHPLTMICLDRQMAEFVAGHPERAFCLERIEMDGWSLDMLAAHLERSYDAAKEYVSQCRKALRKYLQACFE